MCGWVGRERCFGLQGTLESQRRPSILVVTRQGIDLFEAKAPIKRKGLCVGRVDLEPDALHLSIGGSREDCLHKPQSDLLSAVLGCDHQGVQPAGRVPDVSVLSAAKQQAIGDHFLAVVSLRNQQKVRLRRIPPGSGKPQQAPPAEAVGFETGIFQSKQRGQVAALGWADVQKKAVLIECADHRSVASRMQANWLVLLDGFVMS